MHEDQEIRTIIPIVQGEVVHEHTISPSSTVDRAIGAWLHEKRHLSNSEKTFTAYQRTLLDFRAFLLEQGHDLFWTPPPGQSERAVRQVVSLAAQAFANARSEGAKKKGPIRPATQNQPLHHPQFVLPVREQTGIYGM